MARAWLSVPVGPEGGECRPCLVGRHRCSARGAGRGERHDRLQPGEEDGHGRQRRRDARRQAGHRRDGGQDHGGIVDQRRHPGLGRGQHHLRRGGCDRGGDRGGLRHGALYGGIGGERRHGGKYGQAAGHEVDVVGDGADGYCGDGCAADDGQGAGGHRRATQKRAAAHHFGAFALAALR